MKKKMTIFKPKITDATYDVEYKGMNIIIRTNNIHFAGSSNEDSCHRRHQPFTVSDKYIDNFDYFNEFKRLVFNQEAADHFYTLFLLQDLTKLPDPNRLIRADIMQQMIEVSASYQETFINALKKGEYKLYVPNNDNYLIKDVLANYTCECIIYGTDVKISKNHNIFIENGKPIFVKIGDPEPKYNTKELNENGEDIITINNCPLALHYVTIV